MGLRRKAYVQRSVRSGLEGNDIGPGRHERSLRNAAVELQREVQWLASLWSGGLSSGNETMVWRSLTHGCERAERAGNGHSGAEW